MPKSVNRMHQNCRTRSSGILSGAHENIFDFRSCDFYIYFPRSKQYIIIPYIQLPIDLSSDHNWFMSADKHISKSKNYLPFLPDGIRTESKPHNRGMKLESQLRIDLLFGQFPCGSWIVLKRYRQELKRALLSIKEVIADRKYPDYTCLIPFNMNKAAIIHLSNPDQRMIWSLGLTV